MTPTLHVLGASRALGDTAQAHAWASDRISVLLVEMRSGDVLLTAGTPGPEVWAESNARRLRLPVVVYHADGRRTDSRSSGASRWLPENVKASSRQRDEALVAAAARAARSGWCVRVLGLLCAEGGERSGTGYRLGLAEQAGLPVDRVFWGQVPAIPTPEEAAPRAAE